MVTYHSDGDNRRKVSADLRVMLCKESDETWVTFEVHSQVTMKQAVIFTTKTSIRIPYEILCPRRQLQI
jgi:hypothetical protein